MAEERDEQDVVLDDLAGVLLRAWRKEAPDAPLPEWWANDQTRAGWDRMAEAAWNFFWAREGHEAPGP